MSVAQKTSPLRAGFVVLDGIDGCGKSTQARRLVSALARETGVEPLHVREPGSTKIGEALRAILLSRAHAALSPRVETLLFTASRAQTLAELVEPALSSGRIVVCERFHPSTLAYQGVAGAIPEDDVLELLQHWAGFPKPDVEIILALSAEEAARRRAHSSDRIEDKGIEFQRKVARGYARYKELVPATVVIDAARTEDEIARDVLAQVHLALG